MASGISTLGMTAGSISPSAKTAPGQPKSYMHMSIDIYDNGSVLHVNDEIGSVDLVFTSVPKLVKAIATFLKDRNPSKEEESK